MHPLIVWVLAGAGAAGAWLKYRLGRWDQQAKRISELEATVAELQHEVRELVDLKVANALLEAENVRLRAELARLQDADPRALRAA